MSDLPTGTARIFVIDDHPVVRQGLRLLFTQASHVVCGDAECRREVLERIGTSGANVAILDLSLGDESGLELIDAIRAAGVAVLVYSMHEDPLTIERAFVAGASGYVSKRENEEVLFRAIADLLAGRRHVSQRAARSLANRTLPAPAAESMHALSERESMILARLGQGDSNVEIAAALSISVRTVETYCARLATKLELDGMKALRRYAIRKTPGSLPE
jgi:two-component system, NarL family, invasion response regulator UvrY